MRLTQARGPLTIAEEALANSLAYCATFQALTRAATWQQAREHVFFDALPLPADGGDTFSLEEISAYYPYAVVSTALQRGFSLEIDSATTFHGSGQLTLQIEALVDEAIAGNVAEILRRWKNTVGQLLDELVTLRNQAGSVAEISPLVFDRVDLVDGPFLTHPQHVPDEGDGVGVELVFSYGLRRR